MPTDKNKLFFIYFSFIRGTNCEGPVQVPARLAEYHRNAERVSHWEVGGQSPIITQLFARETSLLGLSGLSTFHLGQDFN